MTHRLQTMIRRLLVKENKKLKVDVDEFETITDQERVRFLPAFIFYKSGEKLQGYERTIGSDQQRIQEFIEMHK